MSSSASLPPLPSFTRSNVPPLPLPLPLSLQIEKAFQNSIGNLVQRSPGVMVTTGGTNTGVMKLVGKAIKNYGLTRLEAGEEGAMARRRWEGPGGLEQVRSDNDASEVGISGQFGRLFDEFGPFRLFSQSFPIIFIHYQLI